MIKRIFMILISCLWLAIPLSAQSNKLIRELEGKRGALQKQISDTESLLKDTKKDVGSQLNGLAALTGQIEERKRYILAINNDMEAIERELSSLEYQLNVLQKDLKDKKKKYEGNLSRTCRTSCGRRLPTSNPTPRRSSLREMSSPASSTIISWALSSTKPTA